MGHTIETRFFVGEKFWSASALKNGATGRYELKIEGPFTIASVTYNNKLYYTMIDRTVFSEEEFVNRVKDGDLFLNIEDGMAYLRGQIAPIIEELEDR